MKQEAKKTTIRPTNFELGFLRYVCGSNSSSSPFRNSNWSSLIWFFSWKNCIRTICISYQKNFLDTGRLLRRSLKKKKRERKALEIKLRRPFDSCPKRQYPHPTKTDKKFFSPLWFSSRRTFYLFRSEIKGRFRRQNVLMRVDGRKKKIKMTFSKDLQFFRPRKSHQND